MELELKKTALDAYESIGEILLTQEETAETIVPDYCPDIARMIETDGKVFLHSREKREGKIEYAGTVKVTVLYVPEGKAGIQSLELMIPFRMESDHKGLTACQHMFAEVDIESLETRMLNPRKVFSRCKLIARITGYRMAPLQICTVILVGDAKTGIEKRNEQQTATFLTKLLEKDFTFTDQLNISPGREGISEIMNYRINGTVSESKVLGNKVVLKGLFSVSLLYKNTEGQYRSCNSELPFSQIMDAEGAAESAAVQVKLQVTGADIQIDGDDPEGRQMAVTLYFRVFAALREVQEVDLLQDFYSTAYEVRYEAAPLQLTEYYQAFSQRQMVREVLEIGSPADMLLTTSVICKNVTTNTDGELRTSACVKVLYLDENGMPLLAERTLEIRSQLEIPKGTRVWGKAVCTEPPQVTLGDRGIEVRFTVDFQMEQEKQQRKIYITAAELDESAPKDGEAVPSLVLRCLNPQETVWDLAKKHNSTIETILKANQLEGVELPANHLLLIPRKRG